MICYDFAVCDRPAAAWSVDLEEENLEFLESLDPRFFAELVEEQVPKLDSESTRTNAALAIRLAYGHALETFFALLGAAIQAPHCALAWILAYRSDELRRLVAEIDSGRLKYVRIRGPLTWQNLSEVIHGAMKTVDPAEGEEIRRQFARAWQRFAHTYVSDRKSAEYNSIKHGLRVRTQGFGLRLARSDEPEAPPILDSRSEYGTRFFRRRSLDRSNFAIATTAVNWNPRALAAGVELLAVSINNVVGFLKILGGRPGGTVRFQWPVGPDDAWELPWRHDFIIESMEGGRVLKREDVVLRSAKEILATYD